MNSFSSNTFIFAGFYKFQVLTEKNGTHGDIEKQSPFGNEYRNYCSKANDFF